MSSTNIHSKDESHYSPFLHYCNSVCYEQRPYELMQKNRDYLMKNDFLFGQAN